MNATTDFVPVTAPASGLRGPAQGEWSYDAYAAIPNDRNRYEVVCGVLYMTPAPNIAHQMAVTRFVVILSTHLLSTDRGVVLVSPTDVELGPGGDVVQPDVLVVLNDNRGVLTPSRIVGAPDLVIEVASPSTATYDRRVKMDAYARAGVPEYWIADPHAQTVELFTLNQGAYSSAGVFAGGAVPPSHVIPDLTVRVEQFFT